MRFIEQIKILARQETPIERRRRTVPGVMYGLLIACFYGLIASIVNQLSYPHLPVGVDWRTLLPTWLFLALWLVLGGWFINWFTQTDEGLIPSLIVMSIVALTAGAYSLEGNLPTQLGKIILLIVPVLVVSFFMTVILRWLGVHHADTLEKEGTSRRMGFVLLLALALAMGSLAGLLLTRWTKDTVRAVQDVHRRLQTAAEDPSRTSSLLPVDELPGLEEHIGQPYTLTARPSGQSAVGVDTRITFRDGYLVTCIFLVFREQSPFLEACAEGEKAPPLVNQ